MASSDRTYRVLHVLGRGGFGTVYQARMEDRDGFQKDVAVKLLQSDLVTPDVLQRFRDEARILGLLRDRAILQVDPPIQLEGRWAVVMEFVDGASLSRVLKRVGPMPTRPALELIAEVARALDKAVHQPGPDGQPLALIHRDLKPGNIQLTHAGEVKILDFGNARAEFAQRESQTTTGITGTPGYIAPERFDGIDVPKGDVFSLGGVLHRLLTGVLPGSGPKHELPTDAAFLAAVQLALEMRASDVEDRPDARQVERKALAILDEASGERLRAWSETHVPTGSRLSPDELVGAVLTESKVLPSGVPVADLRVPTGVPGALVAPDDMLARPAVAPAPESEPVTGSLAPPPTGRIALGLGVVSVGAVLVLGCAGLGVGAAALGWGPGMAGPLASSSPAPAPIEVARVPAPAMEAGLDGEEPGPVEAVEVVDGEEADPGADAPAPPPPSPTPSRAPAPAPGPAPTPAPPAPAPAPAPAPVPEVQPAGTEAPAETFTIVVSSVPFGLPVSVDGVEQGKTPKRLQLPAGPHTVRVGDGEKQIEVGSRLPQRYVWRGDDAEWDSLF